MTQKIDQNALNALSRQLAVYGAETQSKLMAMRVYLIGLRGVFKYIYSSLVSKSLKILFWLDLNKLPFMTIMLSEWRILAQIFI